jgi:hypothetical protein
LGRKKTDPAYQKTHDCLTEELRHNWSKWKIKKYNIVDDTFNEMTSKLQQVYRSTQEAEVDIEFFAYIRLDLLHAHPEQIPLLRDMGLKSAFFGIESLNEKSAKAIGKGISRDKIIQTLELCKYHWGDSVAVHTNLIAGLPHETPDTLEQNMSWFYSNNSLVDSFHIAPLGLAKLGVWSNELISNPERYGYTALTSDGGWKNNIWDSDQCRKLCNQYNYEAYKQGITKIAKEDIMTTQNLGYEFVDLKGQALKDLPWNLFELKRQDQFDQYVKSVFDYEHIG